MVHKKAAKGKKRTGTRSTGGRLTTSTGGRVGRRMVAKKKMAKRKAKKA